MKETITSYSDSLVEINDNGILFKYYGLLGGDRFVQFNDIEKIVTRKPTIWSGKWRWHGSGDFKTWFPADYARQNRDVIFVAYIRNKWWRIGFTVEDSSQLAKILQDRGLISGIYDISLSGMSKPDGQAIEELRAKDKQMKSIFWIVIILSGIVLPLVLILYFAFFN